MTVYALSAVYALSRSSRPNPGPWIRFTSPTAWPDPTCPIPDQELVSALTLICPIWLFFFRCVGSSHPEATKDVFFGLSVPV